MIDCTDHMVDCTDHMVDCEHRSIRKFDVFCDGQAGSGYAQIHGAVHAKVLEPECS